MMSIYNQVAKVHNSTAKAVERAIRHSIELNQSTMQQYFQINYKIKNTNLLALLAREMERA